MTERSPHCAVAHALIGVLLLAPAAALADERDITTATLNWEPYYGEDLERQGFFTAITNAAFEEAGYEVENEFMPWPRAMKDTREGVRDVLQGAYYSDDRAEDYYVSDVVYEAEVGIVAAADLDITSFDDMRDLEDYTIAIGRDYEHNEAFDEADFLDKEANDDHPRLAVRQLFADRVDMIAGSIPAILHEIERQGYDADEITVLSPPLQENPLHNMVSRDHPRGEQLVEDFNEGLAAIREDGTYDEILREMGFLEGGEEDAD